jgi:hypothetical protein
MSMLALIERSIEASIRALGDAIVDVQIAAEQQYEPQPGEMAHESYQFFSGKGAFEKVKYEDYPETQVMIGDRTLLLMKCSHDVEPHEFVRVEGETYRVHSVKPDLVGVTRVLQKLLLRKEPKEISWDSAGPVVG